MTNRIFIPIRCKECGVLIGTKIYPVLNDNCDTYYCFNCAFSFVMVNEVIGTKLAQSVQQFLQNCEVKDYLDYQQQIYDGKHGTWLYRIRLWFRNKTNE